MALATYADLESRIVETLDVTLGQAGVTSACIADACRMAEARIRRALRTIEGKTTAVGTTTTAGGETYVAIPADYRGGVELMILDDDGEYKSLVELGAYLYVGVAGIYIRPALSEDRTYRMTYWGNFDSIAGSAGASNWVLTSHPDVYVYGTLAEMHSFMADTERAMLAEDMFQERLESIKEDSLSREWFSLPQSNYGGGTP